MCVCVCACLHVCMRACMHVCELHVCFSLKPLSMFTKFTLLLYLINEGWTSMTANVKSKFSVQKERTDQTIVRKLGIKGCPPFFDKIKILTLWQVNDELLGKLYHSYPHVINWEKISFFPTDCSASRPGWMRHCTAPTPTERTATHLVTSSLYSPLVPDFSPAKLSWALLAV